MIRLARWEHASHLHLALMGVAAVLVGFFALMGVLFTARALWHRRAAPVSTLRRALGLEPQAQR